MATASVTNSFVNGTTADADDVNTDFSDLVSFLNASVVHVDGAKSMTGELNMGSNKITSLATPTAATDAATKGYADGLLPVAWADVTKDWAEVGDLAAIAAAAAAGSSTEVPRADHAHEIVDARDVVILGGRVFNSTPNPTTSFVTVNSAVVTMPSGWTQALVIAWGAIATASGSTASMQLQGRINIDTDTGSTFQSGQAAASNNRMLVNPANTFVTSEGTINIDQQQSLTTGTATLKYASLLYLVIRVS